MTSTSGTAFAKLHGVASSFLIRNLLGLTLVFLTGPAFADALSPCEIELVKTSDNRPPTVVSFRRVRDSFIGPQDMSYLPESIRKPTNDWGVDLHQVFPDANQLLVGIEAPHHWYLVAGNLRHDPRILKTGFSAQRASTLPVGAGVFWRIQEPSLVRSVHEQVQESPEAFSVSCAFGVCSHLAQSGVRIGDRFAPSRLPYQNFARILRSGFITNRGTPLAADLAVSIPGSLQDFYDAMKKRDQVIKRAVGSKLQGSSLWSAEYNLLNHVGPFAPRYLNEMRRSPPR